MAISGFSSFSPRPPVNPFRRLLTLLRGGDYAHAGDKEAVDMVIVRALELSPEIKEGPSLDVGSGFGGTAAYVASMDFKSVHGIDIDKAAILYAKERYSEIDFIEGDALQASQLFAPRHFSFLFMFNVLYSIEDKLSLLKELAKVAKPGALLAIFDYSAHSPLRMKDFSDKPIHPIMIAPFLEDCKKTDWKVVEVTDLTQKYITWYQDFLSKLEKERSKLLEQFSDADIIRVKQTFTFFLDRLNKGEMGGCLIFLRKSL